MLVDFDVRGQHGMEMFLLFMDSLMIHLFIFTSQDVNWWTWVMLITCGLLWSLHIYQLFELSFILLFYLSEFVWIWRPVQRNVAGFYRLWHHSPQKLWLQKGKRHLLHITSHFSQHQCFCVYLNVRCSQVCFRDAFFSLLPRMRYGLFYNTPLVCILHTSVALICFVFFPHLAFVHLIVFICCHLSVNASLRDIGGCCVCDIEHLPCVRLNSSGAVAQIILILMIACLCPLCANDM